MPMAGNGPGPRSPMLFSMCHFPRCMRYVRSIVLTLSTLLLLTTCSRKQGLVSFMEGGKYGFRTIDGRVVVQPRYDRVGWAFHNGCISVCENGKWGMADERGRLVIGTEYEEVWNFSDGDLVRAKLNDRHGFLDRQGNVRIPFEYEETQHFWSEGLMGARLNGKWGFIDRKGNAVIPFEYGRTHYRWSAGLMGVLLNGKWGLIDRKGNVVVPIEYQDLKHEWSEGLMGAKMNGKWGFIDRENNVVVPFAYYNVGGFSEGSALAAMAYDSCGYIDLDNKVVIPFMYGSFYDCGHFTNGIAQVSLNRLIGCINRDNVFVIGPKYDSMRPFQKGFAAVSIGNGVGWHAIGHRTLFHGYVDSLGNEHLIPYVNYREHGPELPIAPAPRGLPDFSASLDRSYERIVEHPGVGEMVMVVSTSWDEEDSTERTDTTEYVLVYEGDSIYEIPIEEARRKDTVHVEWTLEKILGLGIKAFVIEPASYPDLDRLASVSVAYGLMIGGGNYGDGLISPNPEGWQVFRKGTLHAVAGSERLRELA